jgi:ComF family protein
MRWNDGEAAGDAGSLLCRVEDYRMLSNFETGKFDNAVDGTAGAQAGFVRCITAACQAAVRLYDPHSCVSFGQFGRCAAPEGRNSRLEAALRHSLPRASLRFLRAALPQRCILCVAPSGDALLCTGCAQSMPRIAAACPRCALASPGGATCGACLAKPPFYATAIAAWAYAFPADRLLQAFKYGGRLALADTFAHALAQRAGAAAPPDALIALPLSVQRQRVRGFNQAHEIARRVSARTGIPLLHALRRAKDSPPQAGMSLAQRKRNVRGAFEATRPLAGLAVALVDDVMTTGATLAEAARAACDAGARRVDAWVVARTLPPAQRSD